MTGKYEGDYQVRGRERIHGMITGCVKVLAGAKLDLHGMVCEDLIVDAGGEAIIHGMVCGNVKNSGTIVHHGMINGALQAAVGANTRVCNGAWVNGAEITAASLPWRPTMFLPCTEK